MRSIVPPAFIGKAGFPFLLACAFQADAAMAQHMNASDAPCRGIVVTAELGQCFAQAGKKADGELNEVYGKIIKYFDSENRKEDRDALQKAEQLWIGYRDANCAAARGLYGQGTAGPVTYLACLEAETRHRIEDLRKGYGWLLEKSGHPL